MTDRESNRSGTQTPESPPKPTGAPGSVCRVCAELISKGAGKCAKCGAYQDWRRFVMEGHTFLKAILALVVAAVGAFVAYKSMTPAKLELSFKNCTQDQIQVQVENSGGAATVIPPIEFERELDGRRTALSMDAALEDGGIATERTLDPKGVKSFTYPNDGFGYFSQPETARQCNIVAFLSGAEGENRSGEAKCKCRYIP